MAKCAKPCKECPFRKESAPGYLGSSSYDPQTFLNMIEHAPIPCHLAVNWEEDDDETIEDLSWSNTCVGSLQFMRNSLKLPHDLNYVRKVNKSEKNSKVFNWKHEFIKHHGEDH